MYMIKFERTTPGLDDLFITTLGAKRIRGIGNFEAACIPLQADVKRFKSEEEAKKLLKRLGYIDENGEPTELLKRSKVTKVKIVTSFVREAA